ncbi:ubiquitin-conjugating enzyme/RWD-like protein, partial [Leptodontidium sp. 2 PMI_412]
RILLSEIKAMIDNPHHYMDIYVSQSNMGFWKVVMQGPPDSPYADGTFLLYIELGQDFPRRPPSARFITPILHPNITKHGRVCHPIFDREWTPATRVYQVLQQLYGIMMS